MVLLGSSCSWLAEKPPLGKKMAEKYQKEIYNAYDTAIYIPIFKKVLKDSLITLQHPKTISAYYENENFEPQFLNRFLLNNDLQTLTTYLQNAKEHGLKPGFFKPDEINRLIEKIQQAPYTKIEEAYPDMAKLELLCANALVNYTNYLHFGIVNPKHILKRYQLSVSRPTDEFVLKTLKVDDLQEHLASVQPKNLMYLQLQEMLKKADLSASERKKIALNLERLRWQQNEKEDSHFLWVNIPDAYLKVIDSGKTILGMRVCVGEKREDDYENKLANYLKTGNIDDRPVNHETAILNSRIKNLQLNPVWNIPRSIAQSEIYFNVVKDRFYLSNNGIKVFYKGKLVTAPDTINWQRLNRAKMPYSFKQDPGKSNALGKIKFIFKNDNSIYLHDTQNKTAFKLRNRAVSHGCVRVQEPLLLAENLVKDSVKYDKVRLALNLDPLTQKEKEKYLLKLQDTTIKVKPPLKASGIALRKSLPIKITYFTAFVDENKKLVFSPDIYEYDILLENRLKKYLIH